jgi:hypothetical protein
MTLDEMHDSHLAIEMALLRVRHRHEKAGDAHNYTFGELLKEARKELDEQYERMKRTGKDDWEDRVDAANARLGPLPSSLR